MKEEDKKVQQLIDKIIDDFVQKDDRAREHNVFHPSEIPYCYRKNYYTHKSPIPFNNETHRIFHVGNIIHDFITLLLRQNLKARLLQSERNITIIANPQTDIDISGRFDNLVLLNLGDEKPEKSIFEIKSSNNIQFMTEPQPHHIMQIMPYLRGFRINKGYIIYVEKNNLQVKVFPVHYDKEIFLKVIERTNKLSEYLQNNILPPPEGKDSKWECNYCSYKEYCDKNYNPTEEKK